MAASAAGPAAAGAAPAPAPPARLVLVVAVALLDARGRVLLAQRPAGKAMAGLWEFPGGKVDPGETPEAALVRELAEELSIEVEPRDLQPLTFASHSYDSFHLLMPLYVCRRWRGEPHGAEGQALAWASGRGLGDFAMPAADLPLLAPVVAAMAASGAGV
ncbi:mutT [Scenedesmus sp. PABB004]|nr:mutT [Scenedesmus sp. PABB004]